MGSGDIDLTALTMLFGLLDKNAQDDLRAHGGPYECYAESVGGLDAKGLAEPLKPKPVVETVTQNAGMDRCGFIYQPDDPEDTPVRVTFNRIDGKIDLSSYRVEAR